MQITKDSHLDHNLSVGQLDFIKKKFEGRDSFFIETIELPEELGTVEISLLGPSVGLNPIQEFEVEYKVREGRRWASRVVVQNNVCPWVKEQSRLVTVVAGPHDGKPCVLYTVYGGPQAPREPGDPSIKSWEELVASREFWSKHALVW